MARDRKGLSLPSSVVALGVVSLFTDISSEMIFPLLPAFLAARMGAAPLLLGAMEGSADLVASFVKWWSGRWADRSPRLRPMVLGGYSLSALARPWMAWVVLAWQPIAIRIIDRIGKGLRTAPRDVIIAQWVPQGSRARAFGFHRGMDHAGAALGALVAAALVAWGFSLERVFVLSVIPGAIAVGVIFFVREPSRSTPAAPAITSAPVPKRLVNYLVPVTLFAVANSTDAFLLLKLSEQGASPELLPLAWLLLHAVKALFSMPAGWVADKVGTSKVVLVGWALYALSYAAMAFTPTLQATMGVIALYGLYHSLSEGAEKALLADLAPPEARGRAFGLYHGLSGVASLAAGLLFGLLWTTLGSQVAFVSAAMLAGVSAVLLFALLPLARRA